MTIDHDIAFEHVIRHTGGPKNPRANVMKFREFAVSDFHTFRTTIRNLTTGREYVKSWAIHEKWSQLCKYNPGKWQAPRGREFPECRFRYRWQFNRAVIENASGPATNGARDAVVRGHGQCDWFAEKAYNQLAVFGKAGTVPPVFKVSTGHNHNWVLVNSAADAAGVYATPDEDSIAIDYWMLAFGAKPAKCICRYDKFAFRGLRPRIISRHEP